MIRPLRRRHRATIFALTIALAVLFIAGLRARKPAPVNTPFPDTLLKISAGGQR